ncbi:uncharacterized protein LOC121720703 isoform X2 [Alosa sapidissima]|uniref:uncharacterized protein LOC121720703 isoform X2 n=1 Tax=Alosa sapidissima TaxID=34773 RepID=UPI001C086797|nr:uncharacterized protein LOC121720703 isoform X2 [Alosa sapidissima]
MDAAAESNFPDQSAFHYAMWKEPRYPRQECLLRRCERGCERQQCREMLQQLIKADLNDTECMVTSISTKCSLLFQTHLFSPKRIHLFV